MTSYGTAPLKRLAPYFPVRTLQLSVLEGPDQGVTWSTDSDRVVVGTAEGADLVLKDETVSRYHLELVCRDDGVVVVDHGSTNGTRLAGARIERAVIEPGTVLELGRTRLRVGHGDEAMVELHTGSNLGKLCGSTSAMRRLMARVRKAAGSDAAVLVVGESGTGKELVARALHDASLRAEAPFVTVDCGSLAPTLVASELFGHEKGAFTGADRMRRGAFERAAGGTVLLDEVGELPLDLQAALLGVLGRRSFRRVGGHEEIPTDVRIVSATNRDLRSDVNNGRFRLDLYYRLAVVEVHVPPLRERADDIPLLIAQMLEHEWGYTEQLERWFPPAVMGRMLAHSWPGNVRELRNVVEATLVMGEASRLGAAATWPPADEPGDPPTVALSAVLDAPYRTARADLLLAFEAQYLARLLERAEGNVSRAARVAAMDRSHLLDLLRRHGLR